MASTTRAHPSGGVSIVTNAAPQSSYESTPSVFHFTQLSKQVNDALGPSVLPIEYLNQRSKDHVQSLGDCTTFQVSRKTIRDGRFQPCIQSSTKESLQDHGPSPVQVVYRTPRELLGPDGKPDNSKRAERAYSEILAFTKKSIRDNPNIIDVFGIGLNESNGLQTIVTEYAAYGTLADLQNNEKLNPDAKLRLCTQAGEGLSALHRERIVHGDVKPEKILISFDSSENYVAKIGTFGHRVPDATAGKFIDLGGTALWRAPEAEQAVSGDVLPKTDTYSFGLMLWRVAADGMNPFRFSIPRGTRGQAFNDEAKNQKGNGITLSNAQIRSWYHLYLMATARSELKDPKDSAHQHTLKLLWKSVMGQEPPPGLIDEQGTSFKSLDSVLKKLAENVALQDPLGMRFNDAVTHCLQKEPRARDLTKTLTVLKRPSSKAKQPQTKTSTDPTVAPGDREQSSPQDDITDYSVENSKFYWSLEPAAHASMFSYLVGDTDSKAQQGQPGNASNMLLASFYVNGYGVQADYQKALNLILVASKTNDDVARAYCWRIARALGVLGDDLQNLKNSVMYAAFQGSSAAMNDLHEVDPESLIRVKAGLRLSPNGYDALGLANQTSDDWTPPRLAEIEDGMRKIGSKSDAERIVLNHGGDTILHLCARVGFDVISEYLPQEGLFSRLRERPVNKRNKSGETPLLLACRGGHTKIIERLLTHKANASINDHHGESPLHWLSNFEESEAVRLGSSLIKAGADPKSITECNVNHTIFPAHRADADMKAGTPMCWAVQNNRPDIVHFFLNQTDGLDLCFLGAASPRSLHHGSPLEMAAHQHNPECLKLMLDHVAQRKTSPPVLTLLHQAVDGADTFAMMLRHGEKFETNMHQTMDMLLDLSQTMKSAEDSEPLLHRALSGRRDHLVEYLLEHRLKHLQESGAPQDKGAFAQNHINLPSPTTSRTPILEAVRQNSIDNYVRLRDVGADRLAKSRNPQARDKLDQTALHVFASARHDQNLDIVDDLLEAGVPLGPDSGTNAMSAPESPLLIALQNNCFNLAETLIGHQAPLDAICIASGPTRLEHPTTVFGQIIASNMRGTSDRADFLHKHVDAAKQAQTSKTNGDMNSISPSSLTSIEPQRGLTPLHRLSWAHLRTYDRPLDPRSTSSSLPHPLDRHDYDFSRNRQLLTHLLQNSLFNTPDLLNKADLVNGRTALHFAVEAGNVGAVETLLGTEGLDPEVKDKAGMSAFDIAHQTLREVEVPEEAGTGWEVAGWATGEKGALRRDEWEDLAVVGGDKVVVPTWEPEEADIEDARGRAKERNDEKSDVDKEIKENGVGEEAEKALVPGQNGDDAIEELSPEMKGRIRRKRREMEHKMEELEAYRRCVDLLGERMKDLEMRRLDEKTYGVT